MNGSRAACIPSWTRPAPGTGAPGARTGAGRVADEAAARRILEGDAAAFESLVERLHGPLLRLAQALLGEEGAAREVVRDSWLAALDRLGSYAGQLSLAAWTSRIVADLARARLAREGGARASPAPEASREPAVPPGRFDGAGRWRDPPVRWGAAARGARMPAALEVAVASLPPLQQAVLVLRDRQGLSAGETSAVLRVAPSEQGTLLHRARSSVRAALEDLLARA